METSENMKNSFSIGQEIFCMGRPPSCRWRFAINWGKWEVEKKLEPQQYIELRKLWQKKKKKNYNGRKTLHWGKWEVETKMEPHEYIELKKLWRGKKN